MFCTIQHLRWGPSTETVGISSVFTRDASECESQLRSLTIGKGALLTKSWSWWWLNWIRQRWGSLIRSSSRMALIVGRWYHSNIFNLLQKSGIDKLLPGMKMDDFLFSPIGYSMNGIMEDVAESCINPQSSEEHKDPSFMTIHVTPQVHFAVFHPASLLQSQPSCSYASFETNSSSASISLIRQVFRAPNCNMGSIILGAWDLQSGEVHPELLFNRGKSFWKAKIICHFRTPSLSRCMRR